MAVYQSLQGNLGLGKAIQYFTSQGVPVCLPLNDTQKYDLVADIDGRLQKVQIKTSRGLTKYGTYEVQLRNTGGEAGASRKVPFDKTSCDLLFVYTSDENIYLIPADKIDAINSITVGKKYVEYQVSPLSFDDFIRRG